MKNLDDVLKKSLTPAEIGKRPGFLAESEYSETGRSAGEGSQNNEKKNI